MGRKLIELSVEVLAAHLANSAEEAGDIPNLLRNIHATLRDLDEEGLEATGLPENSDHFALTAEAKATHGSDRGGPARARGNDLTLPEFANLDPWLADRITSRVAKKLDPRNEIHPSVFEDRIVCLEDGSEVKLLRAHLKRFDMTLEEYIARWDLPDNFEATPPAYLARKRELAKKSGLGRNIRAKKRPTRKPAA